jgi:hypothetical protein
MDFFFTKDLVMEISNLKLIYSWIQWFDILIIILFYFIFLFLKLPPKATCPKTEFSVGCWTLGFKRVLVTYHS